VRRHPFDGRFGIGYAFAFAVAAIPISTCASTSQQVEMMCPYDGTKFTAMLQASGTAFGVYLDSKRYGAIVDPWPLAVCPTNGFVFFKEEFADAELEKLGPIVLSPAYQSLKDETPYYRAAWLMERSGASHIDVTFTLLQATWEADQTPDRYARYAKELIARLPQDIGAANDREKPRLQIIRSELLRRIGRFDEAQQSLAPLLRDADPVSDEGVVAAYEDRLTKAKDDAPHRVGEAFNLAAADPGIWAARHSPVLANGRSFNQARLIGYERGRRFVWTPDSKRLIGGTGNRLVSFEISSDRPPMYGTEDRWAEPYLVTPDRQFIVVQSSSQGRRFEQVHAQTLFTAVGVEAPSPDTQFMGLAYDGKAVLVSVNSRLFAYDFAENRLRGLATPVTSLGTGRFWLIATDPKGPRVVFNRDETVVIWDYDAQSTILELRPEGWRTSMTSVGAAYSADGARLYIAADNFNEHTCELAAWNPRTGALLGKVHTPGLGSRLAVSADSRYVGLSCERSVTIWDTNLGAVAETMKLRSGGVFRSLDFSPDGRKLALHVSVGAFDDAHVVYSIAD
jgi:hypothetical protein